MHKNFMEMYNFLLEATWDSKEAFEKNKIKEKNMFNGELKSDGPSVEVNA